MRGFRFRSSLKKVIRVIDRLETRSRSIQHGKSTRSAPEVFFSRPRHSYLWPSAEDGSACESPRRTRQKKLWYPGYVNYNQRSQWFKYLKKALVTKHNKISRLLLLSSEPFPKLNCYQSNTLIWVLLTSVSVFFLNQVLENARRAVSETELPSLRTDSYHRSNTDDNIQSEWARRESAVLFCVLDIIFM